jgi:hypothetical protein
MEQLLLLIVQNCNKTEILNILAERIFRLIISIGNKTNTLNKNNFRGKGYTKE